MQRVNMQGTDGKLQALQSACDSPRPRAWLGFHVCLFPSRGHVISVYLEAVRGPDWSCRMVHTRLAHSKETPEPALHAIKHFKIRVVCLSFGEGNGNPTHILARRILWTEKSGRPQSTGLQESDTT